MLKIALVCQHGASTGICVEKMKQAAAKDNIECTIAAYPDSEMGTLVQLADCILLGPQIGFKKIRLLKISGGSRTDHGYSGNGFWNDEWGENFERCT